MNHIRSLLEKYSSQVATTISTIISIILAIFSNHLYTKLQGMIRAHVSTGVMTLIGVVYLVLLAVFFFLIACFVQWIEHQIYPETWDDRHMKHAFLHLRRLGSNRQASFQETVSVPGAQLSNQFLVNESSKCMQLTVDSCYEFFRSSFSNPSKLVDDISFEVTFMTKSYIDDAITIPYSANKENRTPISMLLRQTNPNIFANTETAKIYAMPRPKMTLIEDATNNPEYKATYDGQKERIQSTIILPVLSHHNELLGTLVVHCNQANFFKKSRYDFWRELLEMFSVEIGYYKLIMDYYIANDENLTKPF